MTDVIERAARVRYTEWREQMGNIDTLNWDGLGDMLRSLHIEHMRIALKMIGVILEGGKAA